MFVLLVCVFVCLGGLQEGIFDVVCGLFCFGGYD